MPTPDDDLRFDATTAERAYARTAPLRAALEGAPRPRIALQQVAIFSLRQAALLRAPDVRARFALLPAELLSEGSAATLADLGWALWHASVQRSAAESLETSARVSLAVVQRASEVKARMLRVLDYVLGDDPALAPEVASIRSGAGHTDAAEDLTRLAILYEAHRAPIAAGGGVHYRAADATLAKELAAQILKELGASDTSAAAKARDEAARAFRALERAYEPIRRFGIALFADGEARFPSLYSVRSSRGPTSGGEAPGEPATPSPLQG